MCVETCAHPSVTVDTHTFAPLHRHTLMHAQEKQAAERKANEVGAIGIDQVDTDCGVGYVRQVDTDCGVGYVRCEFD